MRRRKHHHEFQFTVHLFLFPDLKHTAQNAHTHRSEWTSESSDPIPNGYVAFIFNGNNNDLMIVMM